MPICGQPLSRFRRGRKLAVLLFACLCCSFVGSGLGQEPFRVNVRLVNVAFSARDAQGVLIDNLTKDDVEVFEDLCRKRFPSLLIVWTSRLRSDLWWTSAQANTNSPSSMSMRWKSS